MSPTNHKPQHFHIMLNSALAQIRAAKGWLENAQRLAQPPGKDELAKHIARLSSQQEELIQFLKEEQIP
jgi:hypothetical protein